MTAFGVTVDAFIWMALRTLRDALYHCTDSLSAIDVPTGKRVFQFLIALDVETGIAKQGTSG